METPAKMIEILNSASVVGKPNWNRRIVTGNKEYHCRSTGVAGSYNTFWETGRCVFKYRQNISAGIQRVDRQISMAVYPLLYILIWLETDRGIHHPLTYVYFAPRITMCQPLFTIAAWNVHSSFIHFTYWVVMRRYIPLILERPVRYPKSFASGLLWPFRTKSSLMVCWISFW